MTSSSSSSSTKKISLDYQSIVIELESYYISLKRDVDPKRSSVICMNSELDKQLQRLQNHHGNNVRDTGTECNIDSYTDDDNLFFLREDADGMTRITDKPPRQFADNLHLDTDGKKRIADNQHGYVNNDDCDDDYTRCGIVIPSDDDSIDGDDTLDSNWSGFIPKSFIKKMGDETTPNEEEEPEYDLANYYETITEECIENLSKSPMKVQKRGHVLVVTSPDSPPPLPPKKKPPPLPVKKNRSLSSSFSSEASASCIVNQCSMHKTEVYSSSSSSKMTLHHSRTSLEGLRSGSPLLPPKKFRRSSLTTTTTTRRESREKLYVGQKMDSPLIARSKSIRASSYETVVSRETRQNYLCQVGSNLAISGEIEEHMPAGETSLSKSESDLVPPKDGTAVPSSPGEGKNDMILNLTAKVEKKASLEESLEGVFQNVEEIDENFGNEASQEQREPSHNDVRPTDDYDNLEEADRRIGKPVDTFQGLLKDLKSVQLIRRADANSCQDGVVDKNRGDVTKRNGNKKIVTSSGYKPCVTEGNNREMQRKPRSCNLVTSFCDVRDDSKIWSVEQLMDVETLSREYNTVTTTTSSTSHSMSSVQKYQKIDESKGSLEMHVVKRTEIRKKKKKKNDENVEDEANAVIVDRRRQSLTPLTRLRLYEMKRNRRLSLKKNDDGDEEGQWNTEHTIRVCKDSDNNWTNTPLFHPFWYECMYLSQRRRQERERRRSSSYHIHLDENNNPVGLRSTSRRGEAGDGKLTLSYYNDTDDIISIYKYFW